MSTRYVWEKYNLEYKSKTSTGTKYIFTPASGSNSSGQLAGYSAYVGAWNGAGWNLKGPYNSTETTPINVSEFKKIDTTFFSNAIQNASFTVEAPYQNSYPWVYWLVGPYTNGKVMVEAVEADASNNITNSGNRKTLTIRELDGYDTSSSNLIGKVSSNNSSAYPTISGGAEQDGYLYVYKGYDNIDAQSVSVSPSILQPGSSCTVTVSPKSNTYGGTISYLYQYSVNGGSWTTISTTSNTSVSFTIPNNATSIQFRVRSQDNMGFVSTIYVTSSIIEIEMLKAWVGVSGKARKAKAIWIGVNGKARKVKAGWVGVNGKARKFM